MRQLPLRTSSTNVMLVGGALLGLVVGLLIGWVIWPVEWQGATLDELFPEAKAEYIAAVAESYAMYSSPEAAEAARKRLAPLGDDLTKEFESAIGHFSESTDPDKSVRLSNLNSLAAALDLLADLVGATQVDAPAQEPTTRSPETTPAAAESTTEENGIGWVGWLLGLLAAAALVLGGVYLLMVLSRRNNPEQSDAQMSQRIDNQIGALRTGEANTFVAAPHYVAENGEATDDDDDFGPTAQTPVNAARTSQAEPEEYEFDDDPEDFTALPAVAREPYTAKAGHFTQFSLDPEPGETADNPLDEEAAKVEGWGNAKQPNTLSQEPPPIRLNSRPSEAAAGVGLASPAGRTDATARPTTMTHGASRYKLLEIYTAHYQAAIHDYDESHPITDPASAKYIGECGMGVSTKNGLLQNNPEQVVALELWLFDKTDEKNIGSQTRVLLSEYAIDHNLDQAFLKERQSDPRPFTAQPNVRFQLESQNLLLDCTIVEALYVASGPAKGAFQSVKVDMAVHKKI